ncbi:DNA primase [Candidatus Saccharibacteria bacterium]|nr:MAG: DNA primase [Candidatus Saccharibacteria bacterium]
MDAVEDIKARLNIEDVVGEYVELRRAGRNYKGLSPFTAERTPSFMVSPEKAIWHDFSSGKGGNMFSFVMEMEGLDFKGALEHLARKAGVDLAQYRTGRSAETGKQKDRLYQALDLSVRFYQAQLRGNKSALEYLLKKRQFSKEIVLKFGLGYAPNTGRALVDFLQKKGFTPRELQQAGLSARSYRGGPRDMFRGRIMVPLMDAQGRALGFTARLLADEPDSPKYINTPQTMLYDKGRHVFGLHLAKEALRREGFAVLVEGNLDVIASHQAGIAQVVATAGTALTESHLKSINRFTGDIRLAFDQDKAGIAAAERAIPIAGKVGVTLGIITIPDGKDPDELVRKDPELWRKATQQHQYALDWLIEKYQHQLDLQTATGKRQFSDTLLRVVRQLPDQVEQDHFIDKIADVSGISREALQAKMTAIGSERRTLRRPKVDVTAASLPDVVKYQDHFMALVLLRPGLRDYMDLVSPEMLPQEAAQELFVHLVQHPDFGIETGAPVPAALSGLADYVKILGLQYDELYRDREDVDLINEVIYVRSELIKQHVKHQKARIASQLDDADDASALLAEVRELDNLLKNVSKE